MITILRCCVFLIRFNISKFISPFYGSLFFSLASGFIYVFPIFFAHLFHAGVILASFLLLIVFIGYLCAAGPPNYPKGMNNVSIYYKLESTPSRNSISNLYSVLWEKTLPQQHACIIFLPQSCSNKQHCVENLESSSGCLT